MDAKLQFILLVLCEGPSGASLSDAADKALADFPRNEVYRAKLRVQSFLDAQNRR